MAPATHTPPALWKTVLIGILCFGVYQSNRLVLEEIDAIPTAYVAWSLVRHGDLSLERYPEIHRFNRVVLSSPAGRASKYPPGIGIAATPFLAPIAWYGAPLPTYEEMRWLGKRTGSAFTAAATALFYWLAVQVAPRGALPATLVVGLGTTLMSTAAQAGWAHGPATFWILLGTCFLWREPTSLRRGTLLALASGFTFGMAVLTRAMTGLMLGAAGLSALVDRRWRTAVLLGVGAALPLFALWAYNAHFFDAPATGGYALEKYSRGNWSTPTHWGLAGLLISPSRGLFVFSPALLLGLAGLGQARRWFLPSGPNRERALAALLLGSVLQTLLCATWIGWHGGWTYGPRLLTETIPAWGLLMAVGYERWATTAPRKIIAVLLVVLSISVNWVGITERSGYQAWHRRVKARETSYWAIRDNVIAAQIHGAPPP
ncbi:MAG: hypothetical protein P8R42_15190 [Candidatus Binatia bacterium]|nr:hypothetical protein [Candidatus Binatia bacterium]